MTRYCLMLISCGLGFAAEDKATEARENWERAIEAKGGRQLIQTVRSIVMNRTKTWGFRTLRPVKTIHTSLLVPPFLLWEWHDERPTKKFLLTAKVIDLERAYARITYDHPDQREVPNPSFRTTIGDIRQIRELQLFTFMETEWIRPKLLRTWTTRDWFVKETVVETEVDGEIYEWHMDSRSHLPRRVIVRITYDIGVHEDEFRLEDYRLVDGLQLPHRITHGPFRDQIEYKLNVDYDPTIFHRAPSPSAGRNAWMRKAAPEVKERR